MESALKNRIKQFVVGGEAVVLGVDGIPDFNALHWRKHDEQVQLYAFDILALDGEDLRPLPLSLPKTRQPERLAPRATSNRNGGRDHLGILGEIKSVHPGEIIEIRTQLKSFQARLAVELRGATTSGRLSGDAHAL